MSERLVLDFTVPGVPVGKGRPRFSTINGHAQAFTPKKTVAYEGLIAYAAQQKFHRAPLEGPVHVGFVAAFPIPKSWSQRKKAEARSGALRPCGKPDVDNILKALGDGLNGVVWKDDSQIVSCSIEKVYSETPQLRVRVIDATQRIEAIG